MTLRANRPIAVTLHSSFNELTVADQAQVALFAVLGMAVTVERIRSAAGAYFLELQGFCLHEK
jgi:hypothetical protein